MSTATLDPFSVLMKRSVGLRPRAICAVCPSTMWRSASSSSTSRPMAPRRIFIRRARSAREIGWWLPISVSAICRLMCREVRRVATWNRFGSIRRILSQEGTKYTDRPEPCQSVQLFQERDDVGPILVGQLDRAVGDDLKERRVMVQHVLERLRRVVVEVRRRVTNAVQLRNLEGVEVAEGRIFDVAHPGDGRPADVGARHAPLVWQSLVEDEFLDRVAGLVERGHENVLETGPDRD